MCEKKPGTRCSRDTRNALTKARWNFINADDELHVFASSAADRHFLEHERDYALAEYNDAQRAYNATPQGLSDLRDVIQREAEEEAAGKRKLKDFRPLDFSTESEKARGDYKPHEKIFIPYSTSKFYADKAAAAETHREWQKAALKALTAEEQKSSSQAAFYAQQLRADLERKVQKAENQPLLSNFASCVKDYSTLDKNSGKYQGPARDYLEANVLKYEKAKLDIAYNKDKIEDLKQYELDMKRKAERNEAEEKANFRKTLV